jgi:hypothetical protein
MKQIFNFWFKPGQTIDTLETEEPGKIGVQNNIILFFISLYVSLLIPKFSMDTISKNDSLTGYLMRIVAVLFAILFFKYVFSSLLWGFSKLFQGKSTIGQIRLVVTYSLTPLLVLLPFACIQFIRTQLFPDTSIDGTFSGLFHFVFAIITLSYLVIGLCKVNKFSYGYGFFTVFMAGSVFEVFKLIMHR